MAIFSLANRTTVTTIAAACFELRAGASNSPKLFQLDILLAAATASVYGIGRPAAIGNTPTTPQTVLAEEQANIPTGQTTTALAWGTPPTVPANFFRRIPLPATIGAGYIATFPRGLGIPAAGSIVLWNITANSAATDINAVVDE